MRVILSHTDITELYEKEVVYMMGYGNYGGGVMGGVGIVMLLFWLVAFVDLVLLGMWLWKQVGKK